MWKFLCGDLTFNQTDSSYIYLFIYLYINVFRQHVQHTHNAAAIFIPYSERFFLSSRTGLWRVCRYALTPILLTNSTLPQLLTKLIVTNATEIERLKKDIQSEPYIDEWIHSNISIANLTNIDNRFKQALFANWIRESNDFHNFKQKYRTLAFPSNASGVGKMKKSEPHVIHVVDLEPGQEIFGHATISVQVNGTIQANVIVPTALQTALFDEWPRKQNVFRLLGEFAKALNLSTNVLTPNGAKIVLQPPEPPSKGYQNADYQYIKYGMIFSTMISL